MQFKLMMRILTVRMNKFIKLSLKEVSHLVPKQYDRFSMFLFNNDFKRGQIVENHLFEITRKGMVYYSSAYHGVIFGATFSKVM